MSEACFRHEAFFYADEDEFLAGTTAFIRQGLEAEEAILVALPRRSRELLAGALNGERDRVRFVDMEHLGRNPARIISTWRDFLDSHGPRVGVRGIGEPVWGGRGADELEECRRHEALLNVAFEEGRPWQLMCPYDTSRLDEDVLRGAERCHPSLSGSRSRSAGYAGADGPDAHFGGELEMPAAIDAELSYAVEGLAHLRRLVAAHAERAGLEGQRASDLVVAANEIATNSIRHGAGSGVLQVWHGRDGAVVCDFRDAGRIEDPLVGRVRPRPAQTGGRGIWLANQLCDLVQVRREANGTRVRLTMRP